MLDGDFKLQYLQPLPPLGQLHVQEIIHPDVRVAVTTNSSSGAPFFLCNNMTIWDF